MAAGLEFAADLHRQAFFEVDLAPPVHAELRRLNGLLHVHAKIEKVEQNLHRALQNRPTPRHAQAQYQTAVPKGLGRGQGTGETAAGGQTIGGTLIGIGHYHHIV